MSAVRVAIAGYLLAWFLWCAQMAAAAPAPTFTLRLPAQSMCAALNSLARQTHLQLIYSADEVPCTLMAPPLRGEYTVSAALDRLLAGSGLFYHYISSRAIAVTATPPDQKERTQVPSSQDLDHAPTIKTDAGGAAQGIQEGPILEEVIVTAGRRTDDRQRTSIKVDVIDGEAINQGGIGSVEDLGKMVPGLQVGDMVQMQVYLRGIGDYSLDFTSQAAVATYLDQTYVSRQTALGGFFYDLQRVEVLAGPQGTLYGRNASGGAINVITNKPTFDALNGTAAVEFGDYSLRRTSAAVNLPINDVLAVRGAFQTTDRDGYLSDGYNDAKSRSGRLHALFRPEDDLSLLLTADYTHLGGKGPGSPIYPPIDRSNPWMGPSEPRSNAPLVAASEALSQLFGAPFALPLVGDDGHQDINAWGVSGDLEWALEFANLTVLPAWRHVTADYLNYTAGFPVFESERSRQESLEMRVTSNTNSALKWIGGAYFFDEHQEVGPYLVYQGTVTDNVNIPRLDDRNYAGFGELTLSLSDRLRLTGGLRYTYDKKTFRGTNRVTLNVVPPPVAEATCFLPATFDVSDVSCVAPMTGDKSWSQVNWKAGLEYDVAAHSMLYATVATGFKAGGFFYSLPPNTYDPEKLLAFTLGSKNRFFNQRLELNVEGFYWDYKDHQETHVGPVNPPALGLVTINAGKATIYGVNTTVNYALSTHDILSANLEHLHARYDSFRYEWALAIGPKVTGCAVSSPHGFTPLYPTGFITVDCSDFPLARAPQWAGTLGYRHTFDFSNGAHLHADVHLSFATSRWLAVEYVPNEEVPSYHRTEAALTYEAPNQRWELSAYVRNIEDQAGYTGGLQHYSVPSQIYASIGPPRTYGVRLQVNF